MVRFIGGVLIVVLGPQFAIAQSVFPGADWDVATAASQGMTADKLDQAKAWLESHNSKTGLIVRHGHIVAEWYFTGADHRSKFPAYSTTKSLSSIATGLAIADHKLSLTDTVGKFVPDASPETKRDITVKQLLGMNSGVHNNPDINKKDDLFSYAIKEAPMDHQPGAKWDYNNTGLALLSPVFHKATGKQIDEFMTERVFMPIGIAAHDLAWERREGLAIPYSGCQTTARSLGRIGLLALREGRWKDKQIIPSKWLAESIAPSQDQNKTYGYLWWNNATGKWPGVPHDAYAALGRWDNDILIVPSLDLVVVRQSDLEPGKGFQIAEYLKLVCESVQK